MEQVNEYKHMSKQDITITLVKLEGEYKVLEEKLSHAERENEDLRDHLYTKKLVDDAESFVTTSRLIVVCVTIFLCVGSFAAWGIVVAAMGNKVDTNVDLGFNLPLAIAGTITTLWAILMTIWGYCERRLRKRNIKRMGTWNAKLEQQLDPNRSSSGITVTGDTNPSDR